MKLFFPFVCLLLAGLAGSGLAAEKVAAPAKSSSPSLSDLGHSFKNALSEEETRLLIEYMRDTVLAAFKDEEVTLPPDLAFKLEVLAQRLKKESNFYLDNLLLQLEEDIKRSLKEKLEVSPPVPYTPPEVPLLVPAVKAPVAPSAPAAPPASPYLPPAPAYVPPPTNFSPPPWGYVPWFYLPQPTPPVQPWIAPPDAAPAPTEARKHN